MILNIPFHYQAEILKKRARKSKIYSILDHYPIELIDVDEKDTKLIALEFPNVHRKASIYREINGVIHSQFKISTWYRRNNEDFFDNIKFFNNDVNIFLNNINETIKDISGLNSFSLKNEPDTYVTLFSNKTKKYEIWDQNKEEPYKLMKSNNKQEILMRYQTKYPKIYNVNGIIYVPDKLPYFNIEKISDKPYESSYGLYNIQNSSKYFNLPLNMMNVFEEISEECFTYCDRNNMLYSGEPSYSSSSFVIVDINRYNELFDINILKEQIIEHIFSSINDPILDNISLDNSLEELSDLINVLSKLELNKYSKSHLENAKILLNHTVQYINTIHNTSKQNNLMIEGKNQSNYLNLKP